MLKTHLSKNPSLFVRNALRLGTIELAGQGAAHGIVNTYVEVVGRNKRTSSFKGLTNAVLRKIAAETDRWEKLPVPVTPPWLRRPLVAAWGRKVMNGIERAHFKGAPLDLSPKGDPAAVATATGGTLLPTGSIRLYDASQVSALPGFDAGDWWVQDAAAALPVKLLGDIKGLKILDLCAAPGGKTLQLAAAGALVTAVDLSLGRMARVEENFRRTKLSAEIVVSDAFEFDRGGYDVVLLDAPCSATGTIRRHPDLPHAKDGAEFGMLIDQQSAMIDHALKLLRPSGRLVFCTCSLLPDEGEVQIEEALGRHEGLVLDDTAHGHPWIDDNWRCEEGGLRIRPDHWAQQGGLDGFYMAVLTKPA
jgi:16S rRNA (cytosine967-C5)-methyltransferase